MKMSPLKFYKSPVDSCHGPSYLTRLSSVLVLPEAFSNLPKNMQLAIFDFCEASVKLILLSQFTKEDTIENIKNFLGDKRQIVWREEIMTSYQALLKKTAEDERYNYLRRSVKHYNITSRELTELYKIAIPAENHQQALKKLQSDTQSAITTKTPEKQKSAHFLLEKLSHEDNGIFDKKNSQPKYLYSLAYLVFILQIALTTILLVFYSSGVDTDYKQKQAYTMLMTQCLLYVFQDAINSETHSIHIQSKKHQNRVFRLANIIQYSKQDSITRPKITT